MIVSSVVLGYHGCDREVARQVIGGSTDLKPSQNPYDWLGEGIYFWENSPRRALRWAEFLRDNPAGSKRQISDPVVIGAVIELGNCLDLTDQVSLDTLKEAYKALESVSQVVGLPMPQNKKAKTNDQDLLLRYRDCAVINFCHLLRETNELEPFDSIRGVFYEGDPLFPGAKIREKTHIQLAVRNPGKIIGYFWPKNQNA